MEKLLLEYKVYLIPRYMYMLVSMELNLLFMIIGTGYGMTMEAAESVLDVYMNVPAIPIEDAFIGKKYNFST